MDMHSKKQYLQSVQKEYLKSKKFEKKKLLDEAERRTGMNRKYLTRRLAAKTQWEKQTVRRRCGREYTSDLIAPLVELWDIFDEPCGQRLKPLINDELERLRQFDEIWVSDQQADKLTKMSSKTIDRLLEHEKSTRIIETKYKTKNRTPLLYEKIPTKLSDEWDRNLLGQIQIDAVEHCGQSAQGDYCNTISTTDISSHWWEGEAIMGKGKARTLEAIKAIQKRFPIAWHEIHPDNGTSFINYFLYDYSQKEGLDFSRSRPYHKNDNCFVEQKNSRCVRRTVGHVRYDTLKEMNILNDLYQNELRLYKNFFQPVMRLEMKERNKGHVYRRYQPAQTPYQYLMESTATPSEVKKELKKQYDGLNPAELKRRITMKLELLERAYKGNQYHDSKVTFLFDPTTAFRLPASVT